VPYYPPSGCWSCGEVPSDEDIRREAVLHPRSAARGGPWTGWDCRACGAETAVEPMPGGAPVLAPPEAAGIDASMVADFLDGSRGRDIRRRAREWMDRWGPGLELLRRTRRTRPRVRERKPEPRPRKPPSEAGARSRTPPPPPPPAPRADSHPLPLTAEEARGILEVAAGATRKEIDAAYRRGSRRCHPDLVSHLDRDFQDLAHRKFLRLKRAHEILTGSR
jgi:hypothetical protein